MALGFASRGKHYLMTQLRQNNPPGKSLLIFRTHVKPCREKYSAFARAQISSLASPVSPDERGGSRSSRTRGGMQWTRKLAQDEREPMRTAKPCGPDAPTLASSPREISRGRRWQESPVTEEHEISRKPLRRESRIASAGPVCSCAFSCFHLHTRPRVQRASGFPCALFLFRGRQSTQSSGAIRAARSRSCVCLESGYCEPRSVRVDILEPAQRSFAIDLCKPHSPQPPAPAMAGEAPHLWCDRDHSHCFRRGNAFAKPGRFRAARLRTRVFRRRGDPLAPRNDDQSLDDVADSDADCATATTSTPPSACAAPPHPAR